VEGINVRDHFAGGYNNFIDNINAMPAFDNGYGRARLDMQIYNLPAIFAHETLQDIVYLGYNLGDFGAPFIAAATVATTPTPIPGALCLLGSGIVGLIGVRRRFSK